MGNEQIEEALYITGEIVFTIYENVDQHFSIAKIKIIETNEDFDEKEIVVKGHFIQLQKGVVYQFYGSLIQHKKFGLQYDVTSYQTFVPKTEEAVIQYLSSDIFPGVGKKTATRIVEHLGEKAIDKILDNEQVLLSIPNLRKKTANVIAKTLQENQGFEKIAVLLTKYGVSLKMAQQLYKMYKDETMVILRDNPYQFVFEVEGFGLLTADKIAEVNGIDRADPKRIQASCFYVLQESMFAGHVYLPLTLCMEQMKKTLRIPQISDSQIMDEIKRIAEEKKVILSQSNVYMPSLYYAEDHFSAHIKRIMQTEIENETTEAELLKIIGQIEEEESIYYGEQQFEAMRDALHEKVMILTGGPGTGKTTVIKGILKAYAAVHDVSLDYHAYKNKKDFPFILTAPTGRAAKRMQESTGLKAMTIHRLLGWDGDKTFEKNEYEQLSGKLLIIDEFSMVDTWLANHLFKAIPSDMQVLIVGDEDQLPSVGPGQVLSDLLHSKQIPAVQLNEVYRQEEGSKIIQLAHSIKNDACTPNDIVKEKDFSFLPCQEDQVVELVTTVISRALQKDIPIQNIQVLAPMYKTQAGINALNKAIQQLVNPPAKKKRERTFQEVVYRVGDRVIQLVNQPEDGVYNGDIGEIIQIFSAKENEDKEEQIIIKFDEREVVYTRSDYINFTHAYCISIHKSQGSEFPIVILPIVWTYRRMLRKNLLYTAITRSKTSLILCGELDAFMEGVHTIDTNVRYTTLQQYVKEKLQDQAEEKEENEETPIAIAANIESHTNTDVEKVETYELPDPVHVDDFTPYDFMEEEEQTLF